MQWGGGLGVGGRISATGNLVSTYQGKEKVTGILGCLEPSEPSNEVTNAPFGCRVPSLKVIHILMEERRQDNEQLLLLLSVYGAVSRPGTGNFRK